MGHIQISTPENLENLAEVLAQSSKGSFFVAGGTDLVLALREKEIFVDQLIDLSKMDVLKGIQRNDDYIEIGAMTTFTDIAESEQMKRNAFCLYQAANSLGSVQIRNRATLGGNVAHAAPAADGMTALLSLGSEIKIMNEKKESFWIPLEKALQTQDIPSAAKHQVILAFRFKRPTQNSVSAFAKIGDRTSVSVARLNMSVVIVQEEAGNIQNATVAIGAAGPVSFVDWKTSEELVNRPLDSTLQKPFVQSIRETLSAKIGSRASWSYKKRALEGLVDDVCQIILKGV